MFSIRYLPSVSVQSVRAHLSRNSVSRNSSEIMLLRMVASSATSTSTSPKWQLLGAICLERTPIITPPMTEIEQQVSQMLERNDVAKSLKSDHELKHEQDKKLAKSQAGGNQEENITEQATRQTAQDFEDAWNEEFQKFKPAPRTTDCEGDRRSTNRKLDKHLLFVVQEKIGDKTMWRLPQTQLKDGETLRQTAERALQDHVKIPDTSVRILGNAPWGVHTTKYSSTHREKTGYNGSKTFFFKAQLVSNSCSIGSKTDYNWLGREELKDCLEPEYLRSVKQFLIDED